jgi:hypothetical protein
LSESARDAGVKKYNRSGFKEPSTIVIFYKGRKAEFRQRWNVDEDEKSLGHGVKELVKEI